MNAIYKFEMQTEYNGVTTNYAVHPLRKADVTKDYELQQNEKFYRAKLSGKLTFCREDFDVIVNARFETKFTVIVSISWDLGQTWSEYWRGEFWKTDCTFDLDAETAIVTPTVVDDYTDVIAGMEKEYDLIKLTPEIESLRITKRPLIQMYIPGESVVSCFLSGMYWEQDCEAELSETKLINTYHFALNTTISPGKRVSGAGDADGLWQNGKSPNGLYGWTYETKEEPGPSSEDPMETFTYTYLTRLSDGKRLYENRTYGENPPLSFSMYKYGDEEKVDVVFVSYIQQKIYARYLLDVDTIAGVSTYPIPTTDIVENNRNYRRVIGYGISDVVYYSNKTTTTPTEWGLKQAGEYWQKPYVPGITQFYPIGRNHWEYFSIWFAFSALDEVAEQSGRKEYTLKDAYPLHSVISVLLKQIAPNITHEPTAEYSQFLYGNYNPISGNTFELLLSPKSNILAGDYSQPAQKAPITLKMVADMLRNCYRAYWYIEDGKFKIEHIQWFRNGGRYTGTPAISHDLTAEKVTRNGKMWAFGTSQFDYNKPTMPERYQFGWMDDVTKAFEGYPIDIISKYVSPGNIEEITVSEFTSDVDFMLLNPGAFSMDGFALLAAVPRVLVAQEYTFRTVAFGTAYNLKYTLTNVRANENVVIRFETSGTDTGEIAFLDANGALVALIGSFDMNTTQLQYSVIVPENATQIGFRKTTNLGISSVKMLGVNGIKSLPFVERTINGVKYINQNGLLAFIDLQPKYYIYDLPAYQVRINEAQTTAYGITREKKQSLRFPVVADPNPTHLIKTNLGDGQVEKISVNLSSRIANVTLMYDTQKFNE